MAETGLGRELCAQSTSIELAIERGYDKARPRIEIVSSPALNRLLLVGSEVLQIHKAVNGELVGIVLPALGKRCDVRFE
jgi:hypothetical protein